MTSIDRMNRDDIVWVLAEALATNAELPRFTSPSPAQDALYEHCLRAAEYQVERVRKSLAVADTAKRASVLADTRAKLATGTLTADKAALAHLMVTMIEAASAA